MKKTEVSSYIGMKVKVIIDRPINSRHPKYNNLIYKVNYGYIPDTVSGDGEELDAYILGIDKPLHEFTGECIAYIKRKKDDDDKLIIVSEGEDLTDEEILKEVEFQEKFFESTICRK